MYSHEHGKDLFGSEERDQLVVDERTFVLRGTRQGTICVHGDCEISVVGVQQGSLTLRPNSRATISGDVRGTKHVGEGAQVLVSGSINGTVHVDRGGVVSITPSGRLAGTLHVDSVVENRGVRGGPVKGDGRVEDIDGGRAVQPTVENGANIYRW